MAKAVLGLVLGAVVGTGLGFVAYLVLREFVLPYELWSSDVVMWGVIGIVALAVALLGARQGRRSTSSGGSLRIVLWLFGGLLAGGIAATAISIGAAIVFDISQMEGAYAMGVVFVWVPMGAVVGAIAGAVYGARTGRAA
jgi:ABC-type amino acid transport system permease subunit